MLIYPEDDANRQLANGFLEHPSVDYRAIKILPPAGGWKKVGDKFRPDVASKMQRQQHSIAILLVDFDGKTGDFTNLSYVKQQVPGELRHRVFIIGVFSEPEQLKKSLRLSFRAIGERLADDCHEGTNGLWSDPLLAHNQAELRRMASEQAIVFQQNPLTAKQLIFGYRQPR